MNTAEKWHGTTIVLIRKNNETVVAGDGQVSLGNTVLKSKAKKVRKIEKHLSEVLPPHEYYCFVTSIVSFSALPFLHSNLGFLTPSISFVVPVHPSNS